MRGHKVSKKDVGKRLDVFLAFKMPEFTRSQIQSAIKIGTIKLNEKTTKPSYVLKLHDAVTARLKKDDQLSLRPNPDIKLDIVYEDNDIVVINKPPGMLVHPTKREYKNTLAGGLLYRFPLIKNVGEDRLRPGIVHRLDKDTSGLMVIAKNDKTFDWLKKQFSERKVKKKYLTLVYGVPKKKRAYITSSIGKLKGRQVTGTVVEKLGLRTREAMTQYRVKEALGNYSLLEVIPRTGRTHQIRVHLASIGHPVVGDTLYTFKRVKPPRGIKRQFLHAYTLEIPMPDNKTLALKTDLPQDLRRVIGLLKKEA